MPQVFQVLKCYKCSVFQIHQTKKSNKFECKMCGEKQSIKRHYGIGTGKDCRLHVQKLNIIKGNLETRCNTEGNSDEDSESDKELPQNVMNSNSTPAKRSRWSAFIDKEEETVAIREEPMILEDKEVYLEVPKKPKNPKFNAKQIQKDPNRYCIRNTSRLELKCMYSDETVDFESEKTNKTQSSETRVQNQITCNSEDRVASKPLERPVLLETIDKTSKWAQYVDIDNDNSYKLLNEDPKGTVPNLNNLFSLSDDSDLDKFLNI